MTHFVCTGTIVAAPAAGGRINAAFPAGKPTIKSGDKLTVALRWGGAPGNAPPSLQVSLIFSATPLSTPAQSPSPFLKGGNFTCIVTAPVAAIASGAHVEYTTSPLVYGGGHVGHYKLAIVAAEVGGRQWSADPEFDTGN